VFCSTIIAESKLIQLFNLQTNKKNKNTLKKQNSADTTHTQSVYPHSGLPFFMSKNCVPVWLYLW